MKQGSRSSTSPRPSPAARETARRHARSWIASSNPILRHFGAPAREELVKAKADPGAWATYERHWYDGSIRQMEAELGRVRERISELGLEGGVVIAFTSDHGYEFLEHGRTFVGQSVYGELTNVPLILWAPGIVPAGRVLDDTVQPIDVMPKLLDLAGLRIPQGAQGRRPRYAMDRTNVAAGHPDVVSRPAKELAAWRAAALRARLKPDSATAGDIDPTRRHQEIEAAEIVQPLEVGTTRESPPQCPPTRTSAWRLALEEGLDESMQQAGPGDDGCVTSPA